MTPYQEAMDWIRRNPGSGSSTGLAKLILSLYNPVYPFGIGECLHTFDEARIDLATRMVRHYTELGEDDELRRVGFEIYQTWPRLVELADAAIDAKAKVRNRWRVEEKARLAELYPDG